MLKRCYILNFNHFYSGFDGIVPLTMRTATASHTSLFFSSCLFHIHFLATSKDFKEEHHPLKVHPSSSETCLNVYLLRTHPIYRGTKPTCGLLQSSYLCVTVLLRCNCGFIQFSQFAQQASSTMKDPPPNENMYSCHNNSKILVKIVCAASPRGKREGGNPGNLTHLSGNDFSCCM